MSYILFTREQEGKRQKWLNIEGRINYLSLLPGEIYLQVACSFAVTLGLKDTFQSIHEF
jgi:hypothetical protein